MYALKRSWKLNIEVKDVPLSENIGVIDYNIRAFQRYSDVVSVVNEIYLRLYRKGMNEELLETIGGIVEKLNNLVHFQYNDEYRNEDILVKGYLELFDTFEYKRLSEFNKETNIEVHKVQYISNTIIDQLKDNYKFSFNSKYEDIRENYKGFYIGDLDEDGEFFPLISCHNNQKVISVLPNTDSDTVLEGLLEVFRVVSPVDKETLDLDKYFRFEMTRGMIHKEIVHLINRYLDALNYIFNSTSFRENNYYLFDKMEVVRRTDIDLYVVLDGIKKYITSTVM